MKKLLVIGGILACVALAWAASTGRRISDVLHVSVFHPSDLLAAARTNSTPETNVFATWYDLSNSIAANVLLSANTNVFDASNFLFGVLGTNTTVAAGTGATVGTNIVGNQRIYTVGANSAVYTSNSVWVSKTGNDSTGVRGEFTHPFLTLLMAKTNAAAGDTIFVFPGVYTQNDTLLKSNVNWHFFNGSYVTNVNGANALFDDAPGSMGTIFVTGEGEFYDDGNYNNVSIVNSTTSLSLTFRRLSEGGASAYCVYVAGGTVTLNGGMIDESGTAATTVFVDGATTHLTINRASIVNVKNAATSRAMQLSSADNTNTVLRDCVIQVAAASTNAIIAASGSVIQILGSFSCSMDSRFPNLTFTGLSDRIGGSFLLASGHALLDSNDLYSIVAGAGISLGTNGTLLTISSLAETNIVGNTNISGILASNNVRVAAGTGVTVVTSATGGLSIYTVASTATIDNLFTNDAGVVHLRTNLPITIGTNSGPPAPLYIFSGITNDSMSGVEMDFAPLAGSGANRSGLYVWMSSGDAIGGYAPAIYGLSEGTTSNGFGAYCGSVPFGILGKVSSAGSGDSVATIGNNLGSHLGVRYGVSGVAGGPINGNTNVGVFGSGGTNANVAVGVYAELANSISTATDAKYPRSAALILNNRQTAKPLLLGYTNSTYEVFSLLANGHAQLNSNDLYSVVAGTGIVLATNGTTLTITGADTNTVGNTNIAGILASNDVRVAAGANVTVTPSASGGVMTYTVAAPSAVSTLTVTNFVVVSNLSWTLASIFPVSNGTNFQADMDQGESLIQMTNNMFFQLSTNRAAGKVKYAAFQIEAGNTNWTLAFNSSWKWLGTTNNPPTTISSNKVAVLGLKCYGTSETNVVAAYAVQP